MGGASISQTTDQFQCETRSDSVSVALFEIFIQSKPGEMDNVYELFAKRGKSKTKAKEDKQETDNNTKVKGKEAKAQSHEESSQQQHVEKETKRKSKVEPASRLTRSKRKCECIFKHLNCIRLGLTYSSTLERGSFARRGIII